MLFALACLLLQGAPVMAESTVATVTVPLITREVVASDITYTSATISWKTNGDATSQVFYDTASHDNITGYAYYTTENTSVVSEHSMTLTGLASGTTYHYRVRSVIPGSEFIAISDDYTFTTLSPPFVWVPPGRPSAPPTPAPVVVAPGVVNVSAVVTVEGVFTEEVVAESFDKVWRLTIAEGTRGLTKDKQPLSQITMVELKEPPPPPAGSNIIGLAYDYGPVGATFEPPVTLTYIKYDPSLIPEGVAEENLLIAYYNEDAGRWIELDSVVDTKAKTISAKVSHFTAFNVFWFPPVVPPVVLPVIPPLPPAAFTVSHLSVSPSEVYLGETVTISVIVANVGGQSGSYEVTLKINGVVEATKEVTVNAGFAKEVTLTTTRNIAGTYLVDVDGLTASFIVKQKPVIPEIPPVIPKPVNWWLIGGIIAAVVVVGQVVFFLLRRRRRAA